MKVEFINQFGGRMYVDESRVTKYIEAGYKLASDTVETKATEETKTEEKKTVKKRK